MRYRLADIALRTSLVYALAGAVWILLSDWLLEIVIKDPASISRIQTYKGWMFIAITTALLYATLRRELQRQKQESLKREQADAELREHQRKLDTLLDLLPVGITILDADRKVLFANSAQKAIADLRAPTFAHQAKPAARFLNAMGEPDDQTCPTAHSWYCRRKPRCPAKRPVITSPTSTRSAGWSRNRNAFGALSSWLARATTVSSTVFTSSRLISLSAVSCSAIR